GILTDASVDRLKMHREEPLYIGRKGTPEPYFFFNGAIDDIRLYNRALDDQDIQSLFEENGYRKPGRPALKSLTTMLPVKDVRLSLKFYQEVLGFTLMKFDEKWQRAYISLDGRGLMLAQSLYKDRPGDGVLYLAPDDIDTFHQSLQNAGYEVPDI